MNPYQQKWIEMLKAANLRDWKIEPSGEDILIEMPDVLILNSSGITCRGLSVHFHWTSMCRRKDCNLYSGMAGKILNMF